MNQLPASKHILRHGTCAFLVALERELDVRSKVCEELEKLCLEKIEVVKAVDGQGEIQLRRPELISFAGTLGCLLSHLKIYLHCHQRGIQRAIVFEDDAKVVDIASARHAIEVGESSNVDVCCYCDQSTDDQFLNCHAYSISLPAMQACLASVDSILSHPVNVHIDRFIEFCRRKYAFGYRSIRNSKIVQDKSLPYTTRWGAPREVKRVELEYLKQLLVDSPFEVSMVIES